VAVQGQGSGESDLDARIAHRVGAFFLAVDARIEAGRAHLDLKKSPLHIIMDLIKFVFQNGLY